VWTKTFSRRENAQWRLVQGIANGRETATVNKIMHMIGKCWRGVLLACWVGLALQARAGDPTAFDLIKEGNRYVGDDVKGKVVGIHSEKSVGTLTPIIWYVTYFDPDATFKATEVKFGAGKKLEVKRPARMLEYGRKESEMMDRNKLNIDSDKAIKIAINEPTLKGLNLVATQLWLQNGDEGPEWRVRLWAQKLRHPDKDADIGEVHIKAEDGSVVKDDLHINRVD
jgi:hypothetical protein